MTHVVLRLCAALIVPALVHAQTPPAERSLGPVVATSPVKFSAVSQLVPLSDGRVLVADAGNRLVTLLDSALRNPIVILDSVAGKQNSYSAGMNGLVGGGAGTVAALATAGGGRAGGPAGGRGGVAAGGRGGVVPVTNFLMPFRGDSSLWYDRSVGGLAVIDPQGKLGRVMSPPTGQLGSPFAPAYGTPMSSAGRSLVYKARMPLPEFPARPDNAPDSVLRVADSALIVRMDYTTRVSDTVATIGLGSATVRTMRGDGIFMSSSAAIYPFADNVVVTTDGTIAIFHAMEYRLEWITPDGKRTQGARLPYSWRRITDEIRQHILDSVNGGRKRTFDSLVASRAADSVRTGAGPTVTGFDMSADGEAIRRQMPAPAPRPPVMLSPEDVPDYYPPTVSAADVLADGDNRVWIRPVLATPEPGFVVWDVVSRAGGLVDRVRVPESRTIVGFGAGGVVYLASRDAGVVTLEKAKLLSRTP